MAGEMKHRGGNIRNSRTQFHHVQLRKDKAALRQAEYNKLTTQQKLKLLDWALGDGQGAKKQRAKLEARLKEEQAEKTVKKTKK
jgi:hypothetical protein